MKVLPGIDVVLRRHQRLLRGRRVGLIANPTSVTADLRATVDLLDVVWLTREFTALPTTGWTCPGGTGILLRCNAVRWVTGWL